MSKKIITAEGRNFIISAFFAAIVVALVKNFAPGLIPYGAFEFWTTHGTVTEWLIAGLPIFAWGAAVTTVFAIVRQNTPEQNRYAEGLLLMSGLGNVRAGVVEELCYRWLIFLSSMFWVRVSNFILLGFIGWGIPEHLFIWIFRPLADFVTLHGLHDQLYHPSGWAIGAAMLATNAFFRNGHKYQGWFGWINSWFLGMFFFWIMFRFGLPAAMLVHFSYNMVISLIVYVKAVLGRAIGNA